jgi:hypothetical protein
VDRTSADPFPFDVTHQTFAFLDIYLHLCHWRSWDMESGYLYCPFSAVYIRCVSSYQIEYHGGWMDPAFTN